MSWADDMSLIAEKLIELAAIVRVVYAPPETFTEYQQVSADEIYSGGYPPIEYARKKCMREYIKKIFRPSTRKYFRAFPCSRSVPGMVRKSGRWVKRGVRV